jgi:hypothetical protein
VGHQPRSAPLPVRRKWWVERLSASDKRSGLIAERLETVASAKEKSDARAIRGFLAAWHKATRGGNPAELGLRVERATANMAVIFAWSPSAGAVRWLPAVVVPWSHHFERIGQECGDAPRFPESREPVRDVWGQVERGRPPVLPKVEITLVRPR